MTRIHIVYMTVKYTMYEYIYCRCLYDMSWAYKHSSTVLCSTDQYTKTVYGLSDLCKNEICSAILKHTPVCSSLCVYMQVLYLYRMHYITLIETLAHLSYFIFNQTNHLFLFELMHISLDNSI